MAGEYKEMDYVEAGKIHISQLERLDSETAQTMKGDFATASKLSAFYFLFIFSIPVLNWFAPDFMFSRFWGGMTFSWFMTAVIGMAMAFILAFIYVYVYEKRLQNDNHLHSLNNEKQANDRRISG